MPLSLVSPQAIRPVAVPISILAAAAILAGIAPTSTAGLVAYSPYVVLVLSAAISLWFHRGRAFFALLSLLAAYAGLRFAMDAGSFALRATFTAASIFVPLNVLLVLLVPERGVFHYRSYRWLLLIASEIALTAWIAGAGAIPISGTAWHVLLDHWLFRSAPTPFLGRLLLAAGLAAAIAKSWDQPSPLEVGIGGALIAFFVAFTWPETASLLPVFVSAAGAILLVAVLQESHRMAFRDELTGLPGRRALEEYLLALGPVYSVAMVDVDHFKKFNDAHGHDVGDQVLKLVGARLAQVGGHGRAFRYGGEEFSVLFPEQTIQDSLPYLEQLRSAIEQYRMTVRTHQRRKEPRNGQDRRSPAVRRRSHSGPRIPRYGPGTEPTLSRAGLEQEQLSITVSIGVAERTPNLPTPASVTKAADEALYRAKDAGRNRVCTWGGTAD